MLSPGDGDGVRPLPGGDPLRSYFPNDTRLRETKDGLMVQYSGSPDTLHYRSAGDSQQFLQSGEMRLRDVIIIGEVGSCVSVGFLFTLCHRDILPGASSDWWVVFGHAMVL